MNLIRPARAGDASRLAEILIFTKRVHYRPIFQNDAVSFGEMQVYLLAMDYLDHPEKLSGVWVYDDGIVKGLVHVSGPELQELYVEPFFQGQGVGGALLQFAADKQGASQLWVLEKDEAAIRFYQKHGFQPTGERRLEPGTPEFLLRLTRQGDCIRLRKQKDCYGIY